MQVTLDIDVFAQDVTREFSEGVLQIALRSLFAIDRHWLRTFPGRFPLLYKSGVRYVRQYHPALPQREWELWRDIPTTLRFGNGDCKVLACWRAAELCEVFGVAAEPVYKWARRGNVNVYHVLVRRPDGTFEDRSRKLGMTRWQSPPPLGEHLSAVYGGRAGHGRRAA